MLSLERVSPPDFDVDFCERRRQLVIEHVREKYGADRVANIVTYGKLGAKAVVRDLARVNGIPFDRANAIAKMAVSYTHLSPARAQKKRGKIPPPK